MNATIHRSAWLYIQTTLIGVGAFAFIWFATYYAYQIHAINVAGFLILASVSIIVLLITVLQLRVYSLGEIVITPTDITANNWRTLFADQSETADFNKIQDVTFKKGGILTQLLDYGTLQVQTAGTEVNLTLSYVPKVEYWAKVIQQQADSAPLLTKSV